MATRPTAAILVIGDEILKGQTVDTNSSFATKLFYSLGIKVCTIVVIGDDINEISNTVKKLSNEYTFIITSGGVGPTHDDITYNGVATAFNLKLIYSKELGDIINIFYKGSKDVKLNPPMKMAWIPSEHELLYAGGKPIKTVHWSPLTFPIIKVKNVYVFPGLPQYFEVCLKELQHIFPSLLGSRFCDVIYLNIDEGDIVSALNSTLLKFENNVTIGSYPVLNNPHYQTKITLETSNAQILKDVVSFLKSQVPKVIIVDMEPFNDVINSALQEVKELACCKHLKDGFEVLQECMEKYKEGEVAISFNGGKDCTALLHITHMFLQSRQRDSKLPALYIRSHEPFPEVEEFITEATQRYNLELIQYNTDIKSAVAQLLQDHPNVKAILMGNRRTDPYAESLKSFQMTDPGWPQIMRIFPMLDWQYRDVWQVLQALRVPYCSLYDQGYTSLGNRRNTTRNPTLRYVENGEEKYHPAHQLKDEGEERVGRQTK